MSGNEDQMRSVFMDQVLAASGKAKLVPAGVKAQHRNRKSRTKSATEKQALTVRLNPAVINQFKTLAVGLGLTHEVALSDALNLFFRKYGEPEIA
jgi:hypothetical protein